MDKADMKLPLMLSVVGAIAFAAAPPSWAAEVVTTDHMVPHVSTVPANKDDYVQLFVRERDGTPPGAGAQRRAVLMLHGRSVPALAGFDLERGRYSWAGNLAQAGSDVFVMDLQGSGRSPRPKMDDACNA